MPPSFERSPPGLGSNVAIRRGDRSHTNPRGSLRRSMAAAAQLWERYQDWKALTETEAAAILSSNWEAVQNAQRQKKKLQADIVHLTGESKAELASRGEAEAFDDRVRGITNQLILLETQNMMILQSRLDSIEIQRRDLESTSSRLRRVHTRYVPPREAAWENVS